MRDLEEQIPMLPLSGNTPDQHSKDNKTEVDDKKGIEPSQFQKGLEFFLCVGMFSNIYHTLFIFN